MRTIWKYELQITDDQDLSVPEGTLPLAVGDQGGRLMLWCMVFTALPSTLLHVRIHGSGHPLKDDDPPYIGTVVMPPFVWHVFAEKPHGP